MKSKLKTILKMKRHPVAVLTAEEAPQGARTLRPGVHGCVIALLNAASKGAVTAASEETTACPGGKVGLGFGPFKTGVIEHFLSTGGVGPKPGEFYKKSPELALDYIRGVPLVTPPRWLVFKPLERLEEGETPRCVVFLVEPDQLSALATLANYDRPTQDNVQLKFGAGCVQSVLYAMQDQEEDSGKCTIGLTDPSARKCVEKDILSFSIPWDRYLELEEQVEESFLTKETWQTLSRRLETE